MRERSRGSSQPLRATLTSDTHCSHPSRRCSLFVSRSLQELSEAAIATVKDQWSKVKETRNYEKKSGTVLFKK